MNKLHRAKEIIGSFHAELTESQKAFHEELEKLLGQRKRFLVAGLPFDLLLDTDMPKDEVHMIDAYGKRSVIVKNVKVADENSY
jgi:hypothetical protein